MADNTVFDSVFKTMVHKSPRLLVPFINEVFDRCYSTDDELVRFSDEHDTLRGSRVDDAVFRLGDKIYHIECQSKPDSSMVIRMVEYDFAIALERALDGGPPYEMNFPSSCVLFLRHTSGTPDVLTMRVNLPDGGSFEYHTRVVKAQLYSSAEIFEKRLLLLLPYYLMRYERGAAEIASSDIHTYRLLNECSELRRNLEEMTIGTGDAELYRELTELIIKVSDHVFELEETLRKRVRGAMGGEVLDLLTDKLARAEREAAEARERGLRQGIEQGIERGIEQGIDRGAESLAMHLRELGVDQAVIDSAVAAMRAEREAKNA